VAHIWFATRERIPLYDLSSAGSASEPSGGRDGVNGGPR